MELNKLYNMDCMEGMKEVPDNFFDLAIVDPPYGIGKDWNKRNGCNKRYKKTSYENKPVDKQYFIELKRISKHQIIWGWNYYTEFLGSTNYLIIWDKQSNNNEVFKYSKCEIAYTSIKIPCNLVSIPWDGYRMGDETGKKKIHPHQKPIKLYKWILRNYATSGMKIIDTHIGSGSSIISFMDFGCEWIGFEIDKDYYEAATKRIMQHKSQYTACRELFNTPKKQELSQCKLKLK